MAGKDDTETRDIAPTPKRLRDLRRRGQVAASSEFLGDMALLIVLIMAVFGYDSFSESFQRMFDAALGPRADTFIDDIALNVPYVFGLLFQSVLPILAVVMLVILASSIIDRRGIIAAGDNIAPKFERLNPVEGFKKIFSLRSLIELAKSLIKAAILLFAISIVMYFLANDIVWSPSCGLTCVSSMAGLTFIIILAIGALLALISGLIDLPVARFLFKRDNMMSKSELKREQREEFGDPSVRKERRRLRSEAAMGGPTGFGRATFLIQHGDAVVGLRFLRGITPAPTVVGKSYGADAANKRAEARAKGVPILIDETVTEALMKYGQTGMPIPMQLYREVIRVMRKGGLL